MTTRFPLGPVPACIKCGAAAGAKCRSHGGAGPEMSVMHACRLGHSASYPLPDGVIR